MSPVQLDGHSRRRNVLLLGTFGHSNIGDDLLHSIFVELLKPCATEIWCNAADTSLVPGWIKGNPVVKLFPTYSGLWSKLRAFLRAEAIVFGGGSILKELSKNTGRWRYATLVWITGVAILCMLTRKKLYAFGIGVGPLKSWFGRKLSSCIIKRMKLVVVRDSKSYEIACSLVPPSHHAKIVQGVDASFMGPWPRERGVEQLSSFKYLSALKKSGNVLIGLNAVYNVKDQADPDVVAQALARFINIMLSQKPLARVVFFPFQTAYNPKHDKLYYVRYILPRVDPKYHDRCILLEELSAVNLLDYLQLVDLMIAMRLHALIACVRAGIPFIAILYDEKCNNFVKDLNYPYAIEVHELREERLLQLVEELYSHSHNIRTILNMFYKQMASTALKQRKLFEQHL